MTNLTLKITRWYEGEPTTTRLARRPAVDVHEVANGGGWSSVQEMKRKRLADFKGYARKIEVTETEFGFRTEEECAGAFTGMTRVEVVELVAA